MLNAKRGEVWLARPSPVVGHEQGGTRPVLVASSDVFNAGRSGLVVVVPITGRLKYSVPMHLEVDPPEGGLKRKSVVLCDSVRSVSRERLHGRLGAVSERTLADVTERLAALLDLWSCVADEESSEG